MSNPSFRCPKSARQGAVIVWACALGLSTWAAGQSVVYSFTNFVGNPQASGSADGTGKAAEFLQPWSVGVAPDGTIYVPDTYNNTIRKVTPDGVVTTLAGTPGVTGSADGAQFNRPYGVAVDSLGRLYVADTFNDRVSEGIPVPVFTGSTTNEGGVTWTLDGLLGGVTVVAETSTNLHDWWAVQTNIAGSFPSQVQVSRPLHPAPTEEFLRAFYH